MHVYLGLNYATTRKWHRWVGAWILFDVLLHGALYQVLLVSDSSSLWARLHRQLAYYHGVSILAGVVAWAGAIAMLAALVPLAAFKHSSWKWVRILTSHSLPSMCEYLRSGHCVTSICVLCYSYSVLFVTIQQQNECIEQVLVS